MRRKSLSCQIHRVILIIVTAAIYLYSLSHQMAEGRGEVTPDVRRGPIPSPSPEGQGEPPKYLGAASCASSACHGGGGHQQNQFLLWSLRDFHSQRPFATLTTARSKQIADALQIKDPAADSRCASCHSPLREVPAPLRGPAFTVSEGVSCESCHGPAEHWLRSHTRPDYSHADRVATGMRDLKNLYVRANTCIACHQILAQPLLKAGHPELIFELDGQSVSQPKHWREKMPGAQAWLVGQAAALREMSWHLATFEGRGSRDEGPGPALGTRRSTLDARPRPRGEGHPLSHQMGEGQGEGLGARADALFWLLRRAEGELKIENSQFSIFNPLSALDTRPSTLDARPWTWSELHSAADKLACSAAETNWSAEMTRFILAALSKTAADFRAERPVQHQALRAERLVLALDRLLGSAPQPSADARLNELFALTQSLPDFDPARFGAALDEFARSLSHQMGEGKGGGPLDK